METVILILICINIIAIQANVNQSLQRPTTLQSSKDKQSLSSLVCGFFINLDRSKDRRAHNGISC